MQRQRLGAERPGKRLPGQNLLGLALIAALGCGQGDDPGLADSGNGDDGGIDAMGPGLFGALADETGQPLGYEMVLACMSTVCLFGSTDADGRFSFPIDPPADVALKTPVDLATTPRRGAALCPIRIADQSAIDVGTFHVPHLPQGTPIGPATMDPQTLEVGDGLTLTLRRADLTPRIGDVLVDAAARLVPATRVCPLLAVPGEEIVAVYALHPFAATSASPIAVRAPSDLPPGTAVRFRTISEIDGHLSEPVPGQADGSAVETDPSAGISELTWLVISR
jgi:hypothetical protein